MNSCVVYFYKSNKNYFKEDYESAYICSYLKKFGNSDVFLYSPATPLALNTKYDLYFIKIKGTIIRFIFIYKTEFNFCFYNIFLWSILQK